jgi:hypothetical protein
MSRMVSSPAPLSARSVIRVCRLSCHRPVTFAFAFTLFHEVLSVTIGFVGSSGLFCPVAGVPIRAGKTYHSGLMVWNRLVYHFEYSTIASSKSEFRGIVRPSPASVLLSPTVRYALNRSIRPH